MNMEALVMSQSRTRLGRIAILSRGNEEARRSATPETSRFKAIFAALADVGVDAEPAIYDDVRDVELLLTTNTPTASINDNLVGFDRRSCKLIHRAATRASHEC